ncbi:response regulator transcription factor [Kitasatospora sp. GAS204B]|uniref:response regulator transcription factor n=1 Tax=unclassified Kitasatospora TaxID=2633591 RepID=UPI0024756F01|nr:response regulator transcription factor [Kitasatospora sp. GAS204B]MDH6119735.1 two-component system KDP operon response regulator KdpE [Kitasatospora sp. GAS204B]
MNDVPRVLVVEKEQQTARSLVTYLNASGYQADAALDEVTALELSSGCQPDVVVLVPALPTADGAQALRSLRSWTQAPVIVLSEEHGTEEKIKALDAGADDYVTKPFDMGELLARLRALRRRAKTLSNCLEEAIVNTASFTIDLHARQVRRDGMPVQLTRTEWQILEVLVRSGGSLVSKKRLLQEVWGPSYSTETNYLRVYMSQLRRKLEADPAHPRHLITKYGKGYCFEH